MSMYWLPNYALILGLVLIVAGGLFAMKSVIHADHTATPAGPAPEHIALRRTLPRYAPCRIGLGLVIAGAVFIVAAYAVMM
jgi:hypothetical protein